MEIFWSKVNKTDTCWLWVGSLQSKGYGQFWYNGRVQLVHRFAYEFFMGSISKGLQIDHLCRVRHCVNPNHLEPVTNKENLLRGNTIAAKNANKTHCIRGHLLSGDNLYIRPPSVGHSGGRGCNTCRRRNEKRRYHANKKLREGLLVI